VGEKRSEGFDYKILKDKSRSRRTREREEEEEEYVWGRMEVM